MDRKAVYKREEGALGPKSTGIRRAGILMVFMLLSAGIVAPVFGQPVLKKQALILHSYHPGLEWTDQEQAGIVGALKDSAIPVEVHVEYMDTKRHSDSDHLRRLADLYAAKYRNTSFDIIIATDDPAYAFVRDNRNDLFGEVPLVFCGVNYFNPAMLKDDALTIGVVETMDIGGTLRIAQKLQPSVRNVVVINDRSATGLANHQQIIESLEEEPTSLRITFFDDLTMGEVRDHVAALPPDTIVLLLTFNHDREGSIYTYEDAVMTIAPVSAVPIYGVWEVYLGRGIVGGVMTSGYDQGSAAGSLALRILGGEETAAIPVVGQVPGRPAYDHLQLERFGLDESRLPAGSAIINREEATIELPVTILMGTIGGIVWLVGIIAFLRGDIRKRKRMVEQLRESEEKYRGIAQRSFDMIFTLDTDRRVAYVSPAVQRVLGYRPEYIIGKSALAFIPPEHRCLVDGLIDEILRGEIRERVELELGRIDGRRAYIETYAAPIIKNGLIVGIQGVGHDITEQKELKLRERAAYAQIEQNIADFAILGDQIRNPLQVILGLTTLEPTPYTDRILDQVQQIDSIITQLDYGWIHSENVRRYLRRHCSLEDGEESCRVSGPRDEDEHQPPSA